MIGFTKKRLAFGGLILSFSLSFFAFQQTLEPSGKYDLRSTADNEREFVETSTPYGVLKLYTSKSVSATEGGVVSVPCADCGSPAQVESSATTTNRIDITQTSTGEIAVKHSQKFPVEAKQFYAAVAKVATTSPAISGGFDEVIKKYSTSPQVTRMIDWALKNKRPRSTGNCYRTVKEALATQCGPDKHNKAGGVTYHCNNPFKPEGGRWGPGNNLMSKVSQELPDAFALSAKTRLKKDGFINLLEAEPYKTQMRSPSQAPKGAILVYSSGIRCGMNPDCGHTEIKTDDAGKPGYISDYYSADAINETAGARKNGTRYKLVGVMIKP